MQSSEVVKTLVQCDFDGTITKEDMGFLMLDAFAHEDWRLLLTEHREGKIPVGGFNTRAFALLKTDRQTLLEFLRSQVRIRAGFHELLDYCRQQGFRFVIVSNGLDFYIEAILKHIGLNNIKVIAAQTRFTPGGIDARYIGPEGNQLHDGFKEAYTKLFINQGYRVVYVGNGTSDAAPARQADHIFATDELLARCQEANVKCTPFTDLNDVVKGLGLLP